MGPEAASLLQYISDVQPDFCKEAFTTIEDLQISDLGTEWVYGVLGKEVERLSVDADRCL